MKIGIIGALQEEIELLKNQLKNIKKETKNGFEFFCGTINQTEIIVTCCSIGKVNSALATQNLILNYHVDKIINTGVAGSLQDSLKPLDIIIAESTVYHDFDPDFMIRYFPYQKEFKSDESLIKSANSASFPIHIGSIVTGDEFITSNTRKKDIQNRYPNALCVDMESTSIAHTCFINQIPFLIIRCISDSADDSSEKTYDNFLIASATQSSNFVLEIIKKIEAV